MANEWRTDEYGNQVWMPINPGADPGTAWAATELGEVESTFFSGEGADDPQWADYGGYFDQYGTGEFYEKEKMQRVGAGIDIGQIGKAWELTEGQLGATWGTETTGAWGELSRQKEGALAGWGLQKTELERQRLGLERKIGEAGALWDIRSEGLEEGWGYQKAELGKSTQSGLRKAISAQETYTSKVGFAKAGEREFQKIQRDIREGYSGKIAEGKRTLEGELDLGREMYAQTLSGFRDVQAGLGWTPEEGWAGGQYAADEEKLKQDQDRINYLITSGQLTYDQDIASGRFKVGGDITDIGQVLQGDIWRTRQDWREQQRSTLHMLLGMDIWGEDGPPATLPPPPLDITPETESGGDEGDADWDPFEAYDDDYEGFGEDYGYEDWWEHENEFS